MNVHYKYSNLKLINSICHHTRHGSKILHALVVGTLPGTHRPRSQKLKEAQPPTLVKDTSHCIRPSNLQLTQAPQRPI